MSSHGRLPEVLMKKVDDYVDSLAPQIQPRVEAELETFQQKTIDSLEDQIVGAFRSLFNKDEDDAQGKRGLNDRVPDSYGNQSLPFADEISKLTRSFTGLASGASDDLRDIFDITEGRGNNNNATETRSRGGESGRGGSDTFKTFFSAAVDVVQDTFDKNSSGGGGSQKFELDGLLGIISNTVKEAARNPEEKARMITPEIKEKVGAELREQHSSIAEKFTRVALDHIKLWLRGNTSSRDLGEGAKGEIEDQVKDLVKGLGGLFSSKKHSIEGSSRGVSDGERAGGDGESHGGFSKIISEKLSTGLAKVHRDVRLEFRKMLGEIEKKLFELLPDKFQRPLEKLLGGNPFDSQLDLDVGPQSDRGLGSDIKTTLLKKIRGLIQKIQETLRESILGVVNGGHRKFELQSWVFVQNMVEQKVQKYLPRVKITVPDDIGNEGVSVGAPTSNIQLGGGHQTLPAPISSQGGSFAPPPQSTYAAPPQTTFPPPPSQEYPPPPSHEYPPPPSHHEQGYKPPSQYQPDQQQQYYPPPPPPQQSTHQQQSSQHYNPQEYNPQQYTTQPYNPQEYKPNEQQHHEQNQGHHQGPQYGQNAPY